MQKNIIRLALITILILLIPLIAMRFTDEVVWTAFDFVFAATLIFGTGLAYLLISRRANTTAYKAAVGIALATGFLFIWINGAVGIIGDESDFPNLMYLGVVALGAIGALIARLRPIGMSRNLFVVAAAQFLVPVIALFVYRPQMMETPGIIGVFIINTFFVVMFVISGLLFQQAGKSSR